MSPSKERWIASLRSQRRGESCCALLPKYRPSRTAAPAEIKRRPLMMGLLVV